MEQFTRLLVRSGIIDGEFAAALQQTPIKFIPSAPLPPQPSSSKNKAANAVRTTMMEALDVYNVYDLNRLHLEVRSTIDVPLQKTITDLLHSLSDPDVIKLGDSDGERLLENADPKKVIYSFLLVRAYAGGKRRACPGGQSWPPRSISTRASSSNSAVRPSCARSRTILKSSPAAQRTRAVGCRWFESDRAVRDP